MTTTPDDIDELLRFDPFSKGEDDSDDGPTGDQPEAQAAEGKASDEGGESPAADGGDAGSEPADAGDAGKPKDSATADDGTAQPAKPDESRDPASGESEAVTALQEQLRQSQVQIANLTTQLQTMQQQQPTAKPDDSDKGGDDIPQYSFEIPTHIAEGIADEDPSNRAKAIQQLVMGLGQTIHKTVREEFDGKMKAAMQEFSQTAESQTQRTTQAERIKKDYFGKFSHHDTDVIRPVVQQVSADVMREWGVAEWSERVRDEIGKRVDGKLQQAGLIVGQPTPPAPPKPPAKQPHQRRAGSSPGAGSSGPNTPQDISSTLFGNA